MPTYRDTFTASDASSLEAFNDGHGLGAWVFDDLTDPGPSTYQPAIYSNKVRIAGGNIADTLTVWGGSALVSEDGAWEWFADVVMPSSDLYCALNFTLAAHRADQADLGGYVQLSINNDVSGGQCLVYVNNAVYGVSSVYSVVGATAFSGRLGMTRSAAGKLKLYTEPAGGGSRTYFDFTSTEYLGGGTWSELDDAVAIGGYYGFNFQPYSGSATGGTLDNFSVVVVPPKRQGGALVYNSAEAVARWTNGRQYALRFGLGGAGRWQRIAVVHGATTSVSTSDVNYFALYGLEVSAVPVKQRTDTF